MLYVKRVRALHIAFFNQKIFICVESMNVLIGFAHSRFRPCTEICCYPVVDRLDVCTKCLRFEEDFDIVMELERMTALTKVLNM